MQIIFSESALDGEAAGHPIEFAAFRKGLERQDFRKAQARPQFLAIGEDSFRLRTRAKRESVGREIQRHRRIVPLWIDFSPRDGYHSLP